ncbi:right-handed parallel beta-helix repeat-containing protein [Ancylobacter radicis]|uniref:Right-handed parallel beta-helix repeat-containing protein n=1 Tax=Ancylobacter radicis TaxID=2836179 RepID=A0ABS5R370_9HYPH|nr:right-handed parallel beta-helix repeat-containing protein [Ancylobacter radicis]MBS9476106.1 right-handed parallel beta-helix repeat-containing protein [Ancylobacter radicis]
MKKLVGVVLLLLALVPQASAADMAPCPSNDFACIRGQLATAFERSLDAIPTEMVRLDDVYDPEAGRDFSAAIKAIQEAHPTGAVVVLGKHRYLQDRVAPVNRPNILIYGPEAEIHATDPLAQLINVSGAHSAIYGAQLSGVSRQRGQKLTMVRLVLSGEGNGVAAAKVVDSGAAGIAAVGARHFRITDNLVRDTKADGIHVTQGSRGGLIARNVVENSGDDLIAVVSYDNGKRLVQDVLVTDNVGVGNRWGRGITVIGGRDVTITGNVIEGVAAGASIRIAQERVYGTYGVRNILVERNTLVNTQTRTRPLHTPGYTPQGAIDLYADEGAERSETSGIYGVTIRDNLIVGSRVGGVTVSGVDMGNVIIEDNNFVSVEPDYVFVLRGEDACATDCRVAGNRLNGQKLPDAKADGKVWPASGSSQPAP